MTLAAFAILVLALTAVAQAAHNRRVLVRLADVTWADPRVRNLHRIAVCETGGINGGRPLWTHHNSRYTGALGFTHSTWRYYKRHVRPVPRARYAAQASPRQQYAVGLVLVETFRGYSSWPACHRRLGIY
jgi:hypothetical protein